VIRADYIVPFHFAVREFGPPVRTSIIQRDGAAILTPKKRNGNIKEPAPERRPSDFFGTACNPPAIQRIVSLDF
jgi:hypothetical protein